MKAANSTQAQGQTRPQGSAGSALALRPRGHQRLLPDWNLTQVQPQQGGLPQCLQVPKDSEGKGPQGTPAPAVLTRSPARPKGCAWPWEGGRPRRGTCPSPQLDVTHCKQPSNDSPPASTCACNKHGGSRQEPLTSRWHMHTPAFANRQESLTVECQVAEDGGQEVHDEHGRERDVRHHLHLLLGATAIRHRGICNTEHAREGRQGGARQGGARQGGALGSPSRRRQPPGTMLPTVLPHQILGAQVVSQSACI